MSGNDSLVKICDDNAAHAQVHGIIFVSLQIIFGFSTNAIFLLTYFHMKSTCRRSTIVYYELLLYLCVLDMATCAVVMPVDVLQQRYAFTLLSSFGCKVQTYTKCVLTTASVVMTLVIALHRYRKISLPLGRHLSFTAARLVFGAIVFGSMVLHAPLFVVAGEESFDKNNALSLKICGIDDELKDATEVKVIFYMWSCIFCLLTLVTIALYGAIGKYIHEKETRDLNSPMLMTSTVFFPSSTSKAHNEMTENVLLDNKVQLGRSSSTGNDSSRDIPKIIVTDVGENENEAPQTKSEQLQSNLLDDKTFTKSETKEHRQQSTALAKAHTLRPRSQELMSTLKISTPFNRRTRSVGSINDLNAVTKSALRTKQQQQRKQRHDDILRVGMLISLTYFLSVIPFSVALPMTLYNESFGDEAIDIFVHLGVRSLYLRSALNPLLYGLFDSRLRKLYVGVFKRLKEKLR
ncbi:uncharacterized protein LOC110458199 [Mizuhopecten yessoensis]|uniref:uncharacterized protein LOC110458199 n=1 Tax=Mizuhopecten yessoensis TaxID=6573 RepID=UPI000B457AEC|nr:uncharacterized protein LOC110458199 [Mizuhopecten yessoensis]